MVRLKIRDPRIIATLSADRNTGTATILLTYPLIAECEEIIRRAISPMCATNTKDKLDCSSERQVIDE